MDATQIDDLEHALVPELRSAGIQLAYVDYLELAASRRMAHAMTNAIAQQLKLEHAPYRPREPGKIEEWVPFLDDLITLSDCVNGISIIIDNADVWLSTDKKTLFKLIEAFQIQLHHWQEKKKPCHLFFQMEKNDLVRRIFRPA